MRNIYFLTLFCFSANFVFAQLTFQRTYGDTASDIGVSLVLTSDSGYVIAGVTNYYFPYEYDNAYLIKTNSLGDTVWTRSFGGDSTDRGFSIARTSDGGYCITGGSSSFGNGGILPYLIKVDSSGNLIWSRTFEAVPHWVYGRGIQQTPSGGFIITGHTTDTSLTKVYLIKTDSSGNSQWVKKFGNILYDYAFAVITTSDNGYLIAGRSINEISVIKTDSSGNLTWSRGYGGGSGAETGSSVVQTSDGGYIIAGTTTGFGAGGSDCYIVKIDSSGALLWSKTYGGIDDESAVSIQQTTDGGYVFTGYRTASIINQDSSDVLTIRTDSNGNVLWAKTFGGTLGDYGYQIQLSEDGGYIICGATRSFGAGNFDVYLIKLDSMGNGGCYEGSPVLTVSAPPTQVFSPTPTVSIEPSNTNSPLSSIQSGATLTIVCSSFPTITADTFNPLSTDLFFPNPALTRINFSMHEAGKYFLTIKNILGEPILNKSFSEKQFSVDISDFPVGIYFAVILKENRIITAEKFLKM